MKLFHRYLRKSVVFLPLFFFSLPIFSCTIFVLTDSKRTLFFNNEDYSNPSTRVWFLPGGREYYGCAYLGFNNDWAQGGINTAGLAFDWVAGVNEEWTPGVELQKLKGNPSERMLETCATVEEAIAYYKKYSEPAFSYARILIADKTGASVIIGASNGKLYFDKSNESRGFGYGGKTLDKMLSPKLKPTLENGLPVLHACHQDGENATKYSNVFDLRSGDIYLFTSKKEKYKLNLSKELAQGGHFYDLPQITSQLKESPKPLLPTMHRFLSDAYPTIPDTDSILSKKVERLVQDVMEGSANPGDYNEEFWKQISPSLKEAQSEMKNFGKLKSLKVVGKEDESSPRSYLYCIEWDYFTVIQRYAFDEQNKVVFIKPEAAE